MDLPTLTSEGRNRIKTALSHYSEDREFFRDLLSDILGADLGFGKSHTYRFPRTLRGVDLVTGGLADEYVLKVCYRHLQRQRHHCSFQQEAWVWEEALRRGHDNHFAPIVEYDPDQGWSVMAYGKRLMELDSTPSHWTKSDGISPQKIRDQLHSKLQKKGWVPHDVEFRAINERPVVIDYEKVYPEDMFDGLYVQSFSGFYGKDFYGAYRRKLKQAKKRREKANPVRRHKRNIR